VAITRSARAVLPNARRARPYLGPPAWNVGLVVLIVAVGIWGTLAAPGFLESGQLLGAAQAAAVSGVLALGLSLVVLVGEIDISLTSNLAFTTVVLGLLGDAGHGTAVLVIAGLATAVALGALNGVLVAVFQMPSLAVTLGTLGAYQGAAYLVGGNKSYVKFPSSVSDLGVSWIAGVPISVWLLAAFAVAIAVLLGATTIGRSMYAVGRAPEVVRRNGVSVARTKLAAFAVGGLAAGLGALIFVGFYGSGGGSSASGTILSVVTPVALGGMNIYGGSGRISGVVLAWVLLTALYNGMALLNVSSTAQTIVVGSLLLVSMAVAQLKLPIRRQASAVQSAERGMEVDQ
jgi:rhamnose transport system permease protein